MKEEEEEEEEDQNCLYTITFKKMRWLAPFLGASMLAKWYVVV